MGTHLLSHITVAVVLAIVATVYAVRHSQYDFTALRDDAEERDAQKEILSKISFEEDDRQDNGEPVPRRFPRHSHGTHRNSDAELARNIKFVLNHHPHVHVRTDLVRFSAGKPKSENSISVKKRSASVGDDVLLRDVCTSKSDWVTRAEAIDPYGNTLKVLEHIPFNGTLVRQYFYETFCSGEGDKPVAATEEGDNGTECIAVDKAKWYSRCRENNVWTYGQVVKSDGEVGWSVIGIRGACSCAVRRRSTSPDHPRLFIDDLEK